MLLYSAMFLTIRMVNIFVLQVSFSLNGSDCGALGIFPACSIESRLIALRAALEQTGIAERVWIVNVVDFELETLVAAAQRYNSTSCGFSRDTGSRYIWGVWGNRGFF